MDTNEKKPAIQRRRVVDRRYEEAMREIKEERRKLQEEREDFETEKQEWEREKKRFEKEYERSGGKKRRKDNYREANEGLSGLQKGVIIGCISVILVLVIGFGIWLINKSRHKSEILLDNKEQEAIVTPIPTQDENLMDTPVPTETPIPTATPTPTPIPVQDIVIEHNGQEEHIDITDMRDKILQLFVVRPNMLTDDVKNIEAAYQECPVGGLLVGYGDAMAIPASFKDGKNPKYQDAPVFLGVLDSEYQPYIDFISSDETSAREEALNCLNFVLDKDGLLENNTIEGKNNLYTTICNTGEEDLSLYLTDHGNLKVKLLEGQEDFNTILDMLKSNNIDMIICTNPDFDFKEVANEFARRINSQSPNWSEDSIQEYFKLEEKLQKIFKLKLELRDNINSNQNNPDEMQETIASSDENVENSENLEGIISDNNSITSEGTDYSYNYYPDQQYY